MLPSSHTFTGSPRPPRPVIAACQMGHVASTASMASPTATRRVIRTRGLFVTAP